MRNATETIQDTYDCLFMLITNKRVPKLTALLNEEDLIIVDNTALVNYFGPTIATFADLVSFDETIELNNTNNDDNDDDTV